MFYNYDKRIDELNRISKLPYDGVKEKALKKFIKNEVELLHKLASPSQDSQALRSAKKQLEHLLNPREINHNIVKRLF